MANTPDQARWNVRWSWVMMAALLFLTPRLRAQPDRAEVLSTQTITVGGAAIQIDFAGSSFDLPHSAIVDRVTMAAHTLTLYYGRFPVPRLRVLVIGAAGRHGVMQGTTWGNLSGFPGFIRIRIGQSTTQEELQRDWVITHEMVHTALASLPDDQHWLEEGLASYIEPIARVQAGEISAQSIWRDMMRGMPHGEPEDGDQGLDRTHTWGRTYWGGALFCMVADVEIRKQTRNRYGLQDALRAIVDAGGTIDKEWPLSQVLSLGDKATGTNVLTDMYAKWSRTAMPVDLDAFWKSLGVAPTDGDTVRLISTAPLAAIRVAITEPEKRNL